MPLHKLCRKCGDRFLPMGKYTKTCNKCRMQVYHENFINMLNKRLKKGGMNKNVRKK